MRKGLLLLSFVVPILLAARPAQACDYCILSQGMSPLETVKGAGIRVSERYSLLNSIYNGTNEVDNRSSKGVSAKEEYWTTEVTGFYSVNPDLTLLAVLPYKKTSMDGHFHVHGNGNYGWHADKGKQSGLGDISVLGRYTFFKTHTVETTTSLAGLAGIKFATGKTDGKTDDGADYLDSHLQLGTGSTDYVIGVSVSHAAGRFSVSANVLDVIPTEGEYGDTKHQFGNTLNYDITGKWRVHPAAFAPSSAQVFLSLGLNGELRGKEKGNGAELANSGGHTIYLAPGVQVTAAPHWVFELSYQHPVYHNLNGAQLGEDYKAVGSVTYLF
ncbi:MAG: hypothetical protein AABY65_08365 [Nitrospirota bacterium]